MSRRQQIHDKIYANVVIDPVTGCHVWTGGDSGKNGRGSGYPRMWLDGQTVAVHIVNWTNEHGYIPGKKELDHFCRNRRCINPDNEKHVEMVSRKENAKRREDAKRNAAICEEVTQS